MQAQPTSFTSAGFPFPAIAFITCHAAGAHA
jgi:hypothetical protein